MNLQKKYLVMGLGIAVAILLFFYGPQLLGTTLFTGTVGTGFEVAYEDGTVSEFDPYESPLINLFNTMAVKDPSGKSVSRVKWTTRTNVKWDGKMDSYHITGTVKVYVNGDKKATYDISDNSGLTNGNSRILKSKLISASDLQSWGKSTSTNTLKIESDLEVTMTFEDGETGTKSGSGSGTWKYTITEPTPTTSQVNSVSVTSTVGTYDDGHGE